MVVKRRNVKKTVVFIVFITIGLLIAAIGIFPLLWMAISGFKSKVDVLATPFQFFPKVWTFENYKQLITNRVTSYFFPRGASFMRSILMTFVVAGSSVVLSLAVNSLAAYAFARLRFPFKKAMWLYYLLTMFVPSMSILIPCSQVANFLQLGNTLFVLILPGVVYVWSIFFYRQFYLNIPSSLEEAALMDGCSRLKTYLFIFLPLSATPFVIMGISVFQGFWNSFLWPTMMMRDVKFMQVNQLIAYFRNSQGIAWDMLIASSTLASIPLLVILLIFQKYILEGIRISGMK